jgi:hypothetical protein
MGGASDLRMVRDSTYVGIRRASQFPEISSPRGIAVAWVRSVIATSGAEAYGGYGWSVVSG